MGTRLGNSWEAFQNSQLPQAQPDVSKVEAVARAICDAAAKTVHKGSCLTCESGRCTMWTTFRDEARAAINALKQFKN